MTRENNVRDFDPNQPVATNTLWGLPFDVDDAALVVLPVPWEVTVSYGAGTANAPAAVLTASCQVDLENETYPNAWKQGIAMAPEPCDVRRLNDVTRPKALEVIDAIARGNAESGAASLTEVNRACETMVARVRSDATGLLDRGKRVGVLGGDHSVALGLMQVLAERYHDFGILHIDAHSDLRDAYEGFVHSHASIMRNALGLAGLSKLVQVGVRDYCEEEIEVIRGSGGVVQLYSDHTLSRRSFDGETWSVIDRRYRAGASAACLRELRRGRTRPVTLPGNGNAGAGWARLRTSALSHRAVGRRRAEHHRLRPERGVTIGRARKRVGRERRRAATLSA